MMRDITNSVAPYDGEMPWLFPSVVTVNTQVVKEDCISSRAWPYSLLTWEGGLDHVVV